MKRYYWRETRGCWSKRRRSRSALKKSNVGEERHWKGAATEIINVSTKMSELDLIVSGVLGYFKHLFLILYVCTNFVLVCHAHI